jgi:hypothetical protein
MGKQWASDRARSRPDALLKKSAGLELLLETRCFGMHSTAHMTMLEQSAARIHHEVDMWARVIKEADVKPD